VRIGAHWSVPAVEHLRELAATFDEFESRWSHLKRQELGDDFFYSCGLPQPLIDATSALYGDGRDLAMGLAAEFANVTNPARFPDISCFIRHVEQHILSRIPDFETVVTRCETELAAIPDAFNAHAVFEQQQAQWGMRALSPWHLRTTIGVMTRLFRQQLTLLDTAAKDVAVLKHAQAVADERPHASTDTERVPQYAFYPLGDYWEISFEGQHTRLHDRDGFRYIAHLLARPNEEVGIMSLRQLGSKQHAPDPEDFTAGGDHDEGAGSAFDPLLDEQTIRSTLEERSKLEQELAKERDEEKRQQIQGELNRIKSYLANAGFGFSNSRKRAHSTVQKRIAKAQQLIGSQILDLEDHLSGFIKTGSMCVYRPDRTIPWKLEPPGQRDTRPPKKSPET
jgi:hypothetical protein